MRPRWGYGNSAFAAEGDKTLAGLRCSKVDSMPRTCTICHHPERPDIEADLSAGIGYSDVGRWYGASKHALRRHRANHVSLRSAMGSATALEVIALLDKAEKESTWNATILTIREARRHLEELSWRCCSTRRCRHPSQNDTPEKEPLTP
jgi:hypothetical protein